MVLPNKGDILLEGKNISKDWKYRDRIDYLPQIANFPNNLSVQELIRMIKDLRRQPKADEHYLIDLFRLEPFLNKKLGTLSGGTKQKVNLLLTFMFDSPSLSWMSQLQGLILFHLYGSKN